MTIEERIQELRKGKNLSQEQLADLLGVSRQSVSKWESGQSLPEIEKLIAMSELFDVTADYILKGTDSPASNDSRAALRLGSQIVSAVAAMILAVAIVSAIGQIDAGGFIIDIYGGLVIESVGLMLMLTGWFLAGGRVISKPLFTVSVLLAGVLPASFISQTVLRYKPGPTPYFSPFNILLHAGTYILICGAALFFGMLRKRK